jgi:hypothetical protein
MDPRHQAPPPPPPPPDYDPLFDEAARQARDPYGGDPPPRRGGGFDLSALFVLLDAIRRAVPGELEERATALIREFLLTLRSLIDWYLERLDKPRREPRVEDIPID